MAGDALHTVRRCPSRLPAMRGRRHHCRRLIDLHCMMPHTYCAHRAGAAGVAAMGGQGDVRSVVHEVLGAHGGHDDTLLDYIVGALSDEHFEWGQEGDEAYEQLGPFMVRHGSGVVWGWGWGWNCWPRALRGEHCESG